MPALHRLRPADLLVDTITVTRDPFTRSYFAHCERCADSATGRYGWVWEWADTHDCDPELAALLTGLDVRAA